MSGVWGVGKWETVRFNALRPPHFPTGSNFTATGPRSASLPISKNSYFAREDAPRSGCSEIRIDVLKSRTLALEAARGLDLVLGVLEIVLHLEVL